MPPLLLLIILGYIDLFGISPWGRVRRAWRLSGRRSFAGRKGCRQT